MKNIFNTPQKALDIVDKAESFLVAGGATLATHGLATGKLTQCACGVGLWAIGACAKAVTKPTEEGVLNQILSDMYTGTTTGIALGGAFAGQSNTFLIGAGLRAIPLVFEGLMNKERKDNMQKTHSPE